MNMRSPQRLPETEQSNVAIQVAALCWRLRKGLVEVLLITSRETRRWVIPKGWPMNGLTAAEAAAREAWEEAGVRGQVQLLPLGDYLYDKITESAHAKRCNVAVFALQVDVIKTRFPEAAVRRRKWHSARDAAGLVAEPDLSALLTAIAERPGRLLGPGTDSPLSDFPDFGGPA